MSDGMGGWLTYLFSHTTYHYSIPNWGKRCNFTQV